MRQYFGRMQKATLGSKISIDDTSRHFGRAIIMPNLVLPVVTGADAAAYRERIMGCVNPAHDFTPLMTLYLTETTQSDDVVAAAKAGLIHAVKLYPAGATTNSASGVRDLDKVIAVLDAMAEIGLPLCVHGEVTDASSCSDVKTDEHFLCCFVRTYRSAHVRA